MWWMILWFYVSALRSVLSREPMHKKKKKAQRCCVLFERKYICCCHLFQQIFAKYSGFTIKNIKHMFISNSAPLVRIFNRIWTKSINLESSYLTKSSDLQQGHPTTTQKGAVVLSQAGYNNTSLNKLTNTQVDQCQNYGTLPYIDGICYFFLFYFHLVY